MKLLIEDQISKEIEPGTNLMKFKAEFAKFHNHPIVLARVNNRLVDLWYEPNRDCRIHFVDLGTVDGIKSYRHSVVYLLIRAFHEIYPEINVIVAHSLGKAFFCRVEGGEISDDMLDNVGKRMHEIVHMDESFIRTSLPKQQAMEEMKAIGQMDKVLLMQWMRQATIHLYRFGDLKDYFFMPLVPSSGYLKYFSIHRFEDGFLIQTPRHTQPGDINNTIKYNKLFSIFKEYEQWGRILEVHDVGHLNHMVAKGQSNEIIKISEALHEKKIANIADQIALRKPRPRLILIAGPSSSGKTTFSKRLSIQLRVNMMQPYTLSMDNYFVPRTQTPRLPNGDYDYENLEAIDVNLFNEHLKKLLKGEEIEIPKYDFGDGKRKSSGRVLKLNDRDVLLIEGIHGLNDALTHAISRDVKFKIYVSALTHLNIDNHNRISTTDTRLIRRIVRDSHFRSYTALETLRRWSLVREGEDRWIFPFQEDADVLFNSSLVFEQAVLKGFGEQVLKNIPRTESEYSEARRLMDLLSCFMEISTADIPSTSILREFVGGSSFNY